MNDEQIRLLASLLVKSVLADLNENHQYCAAPVEGDVTNACILPLGHEGACEAYAKEDLPSP